MFMLSDLVWSMAAILHVFSMAKINLPSQRKISTYPVHLAIMSWLKPAAQQDQNQMLLTVYYTTRYTATVNYAQTVNVYHAYTAVCLACIAHDSNAYTAVYYTYKIYHTCTANFYQSFTTNVYISTILMSTLHTYLLFIMPVVLMYTIFSLLMFTMPLQFMSTIPILLLSTILYFPIPKENISSFKHSRHQQWKQGRH